jgi:hypothetical protein
MNADPSQWVKAAASAANGNCVEMRSRAGVVELRDTKHREAGTLRLTPGQFAALLDSAKKGKFDHLA